MFLTRAAQIIGKEGFKTFGYALQQKMHQNMTDAKVYGIYQKKIAPKQRITDNKADCTAICRHSGSYESMLAAVSGMDAEYIAVCDESCEFDKDYTAIVSHYIRIQKRAGRSLIYIYTDSESIIRKLDADFLTASLIIHGIHCYLTIILAMHLLQRRMLL